MAGGRDAVDTPRKAPSAPPEKFWGLLFGWEFEPIRGGGGRKMMGEGRGWEGGGFADGEGAGGKGRREEAAEGGKGLSLPLQPRWDTCWWGSTLGSSPAWGRGIHHLLWGLVPNPKPRPSLPEPQLGWPWPERKCLPPSKDPSKQPWGCPA